MRRQTEKPQWNLGVTIYHGSNFGHRIEIWTQKLGQNPKLYDGGSWRGLGIPDDVLAGCRARLDSIFTEHLVTRYGIQDELPGLWGEGSVS